MFTFFTQKFNWKQSSAFVVALVFVLLPLLFLLSTELAFAKNAGSAAAANTKTAEANIPLLTQFGNFVGYFILTIASGFTYFGGLLLDTSISSLIFNMGTFFRANNNGFGNTINSLWTLIRDIANLAFIFGFIYAGISTIINSESANTKRMLASIIIGALLINFSLFFTRVVIDFSNITAAEIYESMTFGTGSIAEGFMAQMSLLDLYNIQDPNILAKLTTGGNITYFIMAALFLMIAGFVFFAGALLLIVRFVALIFIMIFSPVLFAATVFPKTAGYAEKLWSSLFSYSFFAPVYLLLLLVSLRVIQGLSAALNPSGVSLSQNLSEPTQTGTIDVALIFTVAIVFLVMSLQLAQKMGVAGGTRVVSWGKDLRNYGQRVVGNSTFGAAAAAARATAGRGGSALADNQKLRDKASTSWTARQALKLSRVAADSSFDARNIKGFGKTAGIGEGRKGGYETIQKEITDREKKFAQSLGTIDDTDVRVTARKKEFEAAQQKRKAETERLRKELREEDDENERLKLQTTIDKIEKEENEAKINYEKEKQRRIIGSTFAIDSNSAVKTAVSNTKADIVREKEELKKLWDGDPQNGRFAYADPFMSDADKATRRAEIQKQMDKIAALNDKIKAEEAKLEDQGYAGKLEKTSYWKTLILNNDSVRNRQEAGKEVRKAAEKGLPKEKD